MFVIESRPLVVSPLASRAGPPGRSPFLILSSVSYMTKVVETTCQTDARTHRSGGDSPMRVLRSAVLVSAVFALLNASAVGATNSNPRWQNAQTMALPTGATGLPQGYLPGLSCPSAGNCSAVGAFTDSSGHTQGLLIDETSGSWGTPHQLIAPSDAASIPLTTIYAISCAAGGNCAAGGSYQDANGNVQSFVAVESSSTWQTAKKVTLPADALVSAQYSNVKAVSCASPGNCSAVGTYLDSTAPIPRIEGFTLQEVNGSWGSAVRAQLPPRANFNPYVTISQIECPSTANCVAVGSYIDSQNATRPLLLSETSGKWATAKALSLPNDTNAYPLASLSEVTCVSPGHCVAIGTYTNRVGATGGLIATLEAGTWGRAEAMSVPVNAATNPHVLFYGFNGVSCSSIGNCSVGGQYRDRSGNYQGFLVDETNGVWQGASEMALPTGALYGGANGGVVAVSCPSDGNCSAGAAYVDASGSYQALIINRVNSIWQAGTKVILPAGGDAVGVGGGIYGLICDDSGPCTATGSYLDGAGNYQGLTIASS